MSRLRRQCANIILGAAQPNQNPGGEKAAYRPDEATFWLMVRALDAMWISKGEGYASIIQPKYITGCTCESTAERAEGLVTFQCDLFAGRIPFSAQATKDGWVITEFRLPQYKTKVVRGKDGVWEKQALTGK